jgi:hypothetical protein
MINPQKGIDLMNNNSIINRILFAVTIFQQFSIVTGLSLDVGYVTLEEVGLYDVQPSKYTTNWRNMLFGDASMAKRLGKFLLSNGFL